MGEHLEGFAQTHLVGQDASEPVVAQETDPRHALLLIGAQDRLEGAEWRAGLGGGPGLLGHAVAPGGRRLHGVSLFPERRVEEPRLSGPHPVSPVALIGRAVEQHLLQFFDRPGVDEHGLSGAGFALAPAEHQALDVGRAEALTIVGHVGHLEVEPALARRRDLEARLHAHEVLAGAHLEALLQRHLPFALQARVQLRKIGQHPVLTVQLPAALGIGPRESGLPQAHEGGVLGRQVPGQVAPYVGGVGHPRGLIARGDSHGHDAGAVAALQQRRQHGQTAGQLEQELRRSRLEHEVFRAEIGFEARAVRELRPVLREKAGDIGARHPLRRLQNAPQGGGKPQRLERGSDQDPCFVRAGQQGRSLRSALQAQADLAVGLEMGPQGQGSGLEGDRERRLASEGQPRVVGHGPQERHEGGPAELDHARRISPGGQFRGVEQARVGLRHPEGAQGCKRIERGALAGGDPFEHHHHPVAGHRVGEVRWKDHLDL